MRSKAFTLIELLVVIAVIGMLASIVLVSLGPVRERGRAGRAASDLVQITKVLMLYYDANGVYPCFDHVWYDNAEKVWAAPYILWPKNPWGTEYHWEHVQIFTFSISMRSPGDNAAATLDKLMDDGNLSTGTIRGNGDRLEYGGMDQSIPIIDCHI